MLPERQKMRTTPRWRANTAQCKMLAKRKEQKGISFFFSPPPPGRSLIYWPFYTSILDVTPPAASWTGLDDTRRVPRLSKRSRCIRNAHTKRFMHRLHWGFCASFSERCKQTILLLKYSTAPVYPGFNLAHDPVNTRDNPIIALCVPIHNILVNYFCFY